MNKLQRVSLDTRLLNEDDVESLFNAILGRPVNDEAFKTSLAGRATVSEYIRLLLESQEFRQKFSQIHGIPNVSPDFVPDHQFRAPGLQESDFRCNVMLTASCVANGWKTTIENRMPGAKVHYQVFNQASDLEDFSAEELHQFAFQVAQIPMRAILIETELWKLDLSPDSVATLETVFSNARRRLQPNLEALLKYNRQTGLPVFVLNYAVPQLNPLGLLMPKYSLTNFCHLVEELNRDLAQLIESHNSVYLIDFDAICSSIGKRYLLDDSTLFTNHASLLAQPGIRDGDLQLTPYGSVADLYAPANARLIMATFAECVAAYRIISPDRKIKLVIFDLDGTLWHGVAAEENDLDPVYVEGWPLGMLEAITNLWKRGILVAIASKNDPELIETVWKTLYGHQFPLENFVGVQCSWGDKSDSVQRILEDTHLLPEHCLFVDDNPVEREQIALRFPEMRILDGPIATWRRALLWGIDLQVPNVTAEAQIRAKTIKRSVDRRQGLDPLSREEYLASLQVRCVFGDLTSLEHPKYPRAFELLNKTNQFNSTGRRWSDAELRAYFEQGGRLVYAEVTDRHSQYGLTALLLARGSECAQLMMSCRVFGLGVEGALIEHFMADLPSGGEAVFLSAETGKNALATKFLRSLHGSRFEATGTAIQIQPI